MAASLTIRLDEDLYAETREVLDKLGLTFNGLVTMTCKQLVGLQRVPFDLAVPPPPPPESGRNGTSGPSPDTSSGQREGSSA